MKMTENEPFKRKPASLPEQIPFCCFLWFHRFNSGMGKQPRGHREKIELKTDGTILGILQII